MDPVPFTDRREAGRALAKALEGYADRHDVLVLALPRGGVPVASEVAQALAAPLDVFIVRKLGVPQHAEYAMGAIASGGLRVLNEDVVRGLGISEAAINEVAAREQRELERREQLYRGDRPRPQIRGRTVIVIDDGLATGDTMRAALRALRRLQPGRLIAAVPVAPAETCAALRTEADDVVCLRTPEPFHAVGLWYRNFPQTEDEEVRALLGLSPLPEAGTEGRPAERRTPSWRG
jgi:putative phosphoribosyl transferase